MFLTAVSHMDGVSYLKVPVPVISPFVPSKHISGI